MLGTSRYDSYVLVTNLTDPNERLYVELYTPPTKDSPWGKGILPSESNGFLVWHEDRSIGKKFQHPSYSWPSTERTRGQNDYTFTGAIAGQPDKLTASTGRPLVRLIGAHGKLHLENTSDMLPHAEDLFHTGVLLLTNFSAGLGLYRAQIQGTLSFDQTERTVSLQTSKLALLAEKASSPEHSSLDLYKANASGLETRQFLNRLSRDTNLLSSSLNKSTFIRIPSEEVATLIDGIHKPALLKSHKTLRTFNLRDMLPAGAPKQVVPAKQSALTFLGAEGQGEHFILAEDGNSVQEIAGADIPLHGASPVSDASMRGDQLISLFNINNPDIHIHVSSNVSNKAVFPNVSIVPFSFAAKVEDIEIPLSLTDGSLDYRNNTVLDRVALRACLKSPQC